MAHEVSSVPLSLTTMQGVPQKSAVQEIILAAGHPHRTLTRQTVALTGLSRPCRGIILVDEKCNGLN